MGVTGPLLNTRGVARHTHETEGKSAIGIGEVVDHIGVCVRVCMCVCDVCVCVRVSVCV